MISAAALLVAWSLDTAFGEPRSAWHPVAWFGRLTNPLGRWAKTLPRQAALMVGAVLWCALVGGVATVGYAIQAAVASAPFWIAIPILGLALKPAFAWRMLRDEVQAVEDALSDGIDAGRHRLSRLCSRDVAQLNAAAVRETAIETLAENFNDSLVAPLFWFVVAGLPGAWAWRAVNTLDAMWGYRGQWEWAGKWAARADDVLGWVPARLAAGLLWRPVVGLRVWMNEARRTQSPNSGWPMATIALRLQIRLSKPGVYVLNAGAPPPDASASAKALRAVGTASTWAFMLTMGCLLLASVQASR